MSEEGDVDGVPHIKATEALNLDVDLPMGTEAAGATQVPGLCGACNPAISKPTARRIA